MAKQKAEKKVEVPEVKEELTKEQVVTGDKITTGTIKGEEITAPANPKPFFEPIERWEKGTPLSAENFNKTVDRLNEISEYFNSLG